MSSYELASNISQALELGDSALGAAAATADAGGLVPISYEALADTFDWQPWWGGAS